MVDVYSALSPMMTTQKKILPAGGAFNPSSFLSQSPDFLKPGLCYVQDFLYLWTKFFKQNTARTVASVFIYAAHFVCIDAYIILLLSVQTLLVSSPVYRSC